MEHDLIIITSENETGQSSKLLHGRGSLRRALANMANHKLQASRMIMDEATYNSILDWSNGKTT